MTIKNAMILAAGIGSRMRPLTLSTPKPLLKIGDKNLLERAINLLILHGVKKLVINTHYLSEKIEKFVHNQNFKIKIKISNESKELLDTGGGILNATKEFEDEPFFVLNPDTLWSTPYLKEIQNLEKLFYEKNKASLLLVDKNLSEDKSFLGDFNLEKNSLIKRDKDNKFIFTGLQVLKRNNFSEFENNRIFSMNKVWDKLILSKNLVGLQSKIKFFHLNTKKSYDSIKNIQIID